MKTVWEKLNEKQLTELMELSEDYKKFLDKAKTEREAVAQSIALAKNAGFKEFKAGKKIKSGDKLYFHKR